MDDHFDMNAPFDAPIRAREAREKAEHEKAMEYMRSPEFAALIQDILKGKTWPWQLMETAPKDGSHILAINAAVGTTGFGWYNGKNVPMQTVVHWWDHPGEEGWYASVDAGNHPLRLTHWMPLPTAPSGEAK